MTLYGEGPEVFAQRPTRLAFAIASFCIILLSAQFTTLGLSLLDALLAFAHQWKRDWILYAPLADTVQHGMYLVPPLGESYRLLPVVAVFVALIVPVVLIFMWPVEQRFSSLLTVHLLALTVVTFGVLATGFEPASFAELERRTGIQQIIWQAVVLLLGLFAVLRTERRTVELMTNVMKLDRPVQRTGWWLLRILPAFAVLAAVCYLNRYNSGSYAALAVLLVTFLENIGRMPRQRFHHVKSPQLRGAAAVLPLLLAGVVGGSIYLFGMKAFDLPPQVVVYSPPARVGVELLAEARERRRPVIEIRWAKPERGRAGRAPAGEAARAPR